MDLILTTISGANNGSSVVIAEGQCETFGRTSNSLHVFEVDKTMSSVHFEIENIRGSRLVRDKGSVNGTWLNGKRVDQDSLKNGDRIRAGVTTFEVQFKENPLPVENRSADKLPSMLELAEAVSGSGLSPICDSSLIPSPKTDEMDLVQQQLPDFVFFKKKLTVGADSGLPILVDGLSREWSVQLVMHPLKIRQWMPERGFVPMWRDELAKTGPIAMPWTTFKTEHFPCLSRLIAADAVVFFFGWEQDNVASRLKELSDLELNGFSEANGLLPCFWPSSLCTILDVCGAKVCKYLFGSTITGALFTSPWDDQTVVGVGTREVESSLSKFHFESTERVIPGNS